MEPDDDIHYTLIALRVLEEYGPDFKWRDVAATWNACLPLQCNLYGRNASHSQLQQCGAQDRGIRLGDTRIYSHQ